MVTDDLLEVDETRAVTDIIAYEDEIWPEQSPVLRACGVAEF